MMRAKRNGINDSTGNMKYSEHNKRITNRLRLGNVKISM